jgi:hypothetical protein
MHSILEPGLDLARDVVRMTSYSSPRGILNDGSAKHNSALRNARTTEKLGLAGFAGNFTPDELAISESRVTCSKWLQLG